MTTPTKKSSNGLVVQGSILAVASLIVRLIGFFYRVPLTNMLGAKGMGYYSAAFSLYSFALIISTYAFPAALSKIISKKIALKKYKEADAVFKASLALSGLMGIIMASILFFQAENLANMIMIPESALSLKALAPAILIFSFLSVFRGYFQGMNTMVPTGISQVIEQIVNAIASLSFGHILLKQSLEKGAAGGNLGASFGALFALIFMLLVYFMARPRFNKRMAKDKVSNVNDDMMFYNWRIILGTVIPMMLGTTAFQLANLSDTVLFSRGLLSHGLDPDFVKSQFGVLTSKYSLLIMLPVSIATALATASIPSITKSLAKKEYMAIQHKAKLSIKVVMMISIPAAFGLGFLAKPILTMLFPTTIDMEQTALLMKIGAVSVIAYSLSSISIAILQGLNKIFVPVKNSVIAVGIKIAMTFILLYVFNFGLIGAVINSVIFSFVVAGLNFYRVKKQIKLKLDYKSVVGIPLISGMLMGIISMLTHMMLMAVIGSNAISTIIAIIVAIVVYFSSMIFFGGITEEVLRALPMGRKLTTAAKKFNWI